MKETETKTQNKNDKKNIAKKNEKKGSSVFMKILNSIINIMIVLVLIVSLLIAVLALTSKSSGAPSIFGYTLQTIQSPSMKGGSKEYDGGDFEEGDVIIGKVADSERKEPYEVGDIVSYVGVLSGTDQEGLICHRIIQLEEGGDGSVGYITKGDNNPDPDSSVHYNDQIKSVFYTKDYHGLKIKGIGNFLDFIQSQKGFFLVILLPMIVFFLYELIRVILNFANYKNAKSDEEKEEAVKEAVAAAKAGTDSETKLPDGITAEQMEQFKQFLASQNQQKPVESDSVAEAEAEPAEDAVEEATEQESEEE